MTADLRESIICLRYATALIPSPCHSGEERVCFLRSSIHEGQLQAWGNVDRTIGEVKIHFFLICLFSSVLMRNN